MPPETLPDPEDPVAVPPKRSGRDRPKVLDIGAGDIEAPANAIPNIIADLVETMQKRPDLIEPTMHLFSASRHVERVADHATNIAEDVVYLVEGEIIRHRREI